MVYYSREKERGKGTGMTDFKRMVLIVALFTSSALMLLDYGSTMSMMVIGLNTMTSLRLAKEWYSKKD
jgi:hypothetical protein